VVAFAWSILVSGSAESRGCYCAGEAETIFQRLIDAPTVYGTYNPNAGVIYSRAKVEAIHGRSAGEAFAAVASRFRGLELEAVPFVRREFCMAYESARASHGAATITPPDHMLPSSPGPNKALQAAESSINAHHLHFETIIRPVAKAVDFNDRLEELRRQAKELA